MVSPVGLLLLFLLSVAATTMTLVNGTAQPYINETNNLDIAVAIFLMFGALPLSMIIYACICGCPYAERDEV
jgi:hypothetical protein